MSSLVPEEEMNARAGQELTMLLNYLTNGFGQSIRYDGGPGWEQRKRNKEVRYLKAKSFVLMRIEQRLKDGTYRNPTFKPVTGWLYKELEQNNLNW